MADETPSPPGGDLFLQCAGMALSTRKVELGTAVTNPYIRHPAVIASCMITLDQMSRGRAILGLSTGGPSQLTRVGMYPLNRPVATLRESVNAIRSLLAGEEVTCRSSTFELKGVRYSRTSRKVPIYLAARSEQLMRLVGEVADGEILNCAPSVRYIECSRNMICEGAKRARRNEATIELMGIPDLSLGKNSRAAVENARVMVARRIGYHPQRVAEMLGIKQGDYAQINSAVRAGKMDEAAKLVDEDMIEKVAMAGDPEDVVEKCLLVAGAGVTELAFPLRTNGKETLKLLLERVIPPLKKKL